MLGLGEEVTTVSFSVESVDKPCRGGKKKTKKKNPKISVTHGISKLPLSASLERIGHKLYNIEQ